MTSLLGIGQGSLATFVLTIQPTDILNIWANQVPSFWWRDMVLGVNICIFVMVPRHLELR